MKIAILTPTFSYFSGPDRVVQQQALQFKKEGHEVTIFTLAAEIPASEGTKVVVMGMPKSLFLQRIYRLFFFVDILKVREYTSMLQGMDKIICHMYPMTIIARRAQKKYKLHYQYYNMGIAYPELFQNVAERTYMRLFRYFTALTVRGADSAISISNFLQEELKKETGVDGKVEYCTVNEQFYRKYSAKKIKEKYQLTFPTLLYVGRISPHKGIHLLLSAFKLVQQEFPDAKLLVVGKHTFDDYSKELQKMRGEEGNIIFTGFVADEELPYYFAACDVYTTATLWEGFNLPAAEAQAMNKPVVAFNIGSHPEVIKKGVLVEPGKVEQFAQATITMLKEKRDHRKTKSDPSPV